MKYFDVKVKINNIRKQNKGIETNYYANVLSDEDDVITFESEKAIIYIMQEPFRQRVYFVSADEGELMELLQLVPKGAVLEYVHKDVNPALLNTFQEGKLEKYATYIRHTTCYVENPFLFPEKGRRALLQELYEPNFGEYATVSDVDELYDLTKETFDVICDDVYTKEKWTEIVQNKECLLYRDNGKIISYYVWRLEGKKLYSNISLNKGPANVLYNLERRILEQMWEKGIRIYYAWYNVENSAALSRTNKNEEISKCVKSHSQIYNSIFVRK